MEIKIMVVPGKIAKVSLTTGATVLDACALATTQCPGIDWVGLAKEREVRVQNRKFSNSSDVSDGYFGTIGGTALSDGDVVLILTKIKGNVGLGVLTCIINGVEYALETPDTLTNVLRDVVGIDIDEIETVFVNGEEAHLGNLVGSGDEIEVAIFHEERELETLYTEDETITVTIGGQTVTGRPRDINRILSGC